jgi:hypothetical protein
MAAKAGKGRIDAFSAQHEPIRPRNRVRRHGRHAATFVKMSPLETFERRSFPGDGATSPGEEGPPPAALAWASLANWPGGGKAAQLWGGKSDASYTFEGCWQWKSSPPPAPRYWVSRLECGSRHFPTWVSNNRLAARAAPCPRPRQSVAGLHRNGGRGRSRQPPGGLHDDGAAIWKVCRRRARGVRHKVSGMSQFVSQLTPRRLVTRAGDLLGIGRATRQRLVPGRAGLGAFGRGSKYSRCNSLHARLTTPSPSSTTPASRTATASRKAPRAAGSSGWACAIRISSWLSDKASSPLGLLHAGIAHRAVLPEADQQ